MPSWPLYRLRQVSGVVLVGYKFLGFYPFEFPISSSLALQGSEGVMGLGHPKIFMGQRMSAVGLPWAGLGMLKLRTRRV